MSLKARASFFVMRVPLVEMTTRIPLSTAYWASSGRSGRMRGSPPESSSTLLPAALASARSRSTSVYCAAKFAVLGFAKALREEVQHQGIRVHTLCPGLVQVPPPACLGDRKPGWLQVEDLAEAVLYTLRQGAHVQLDEIGMTGI